ncbi:MAG: hypothetical protein RLZZ479_694 [Bacteroidota bacterium]|jgi:hypothetical protein
MTKEQIYQWTKGDKVGTIVKSSGEIWKEDNIEYLVFNDGSMINTLLINEYLIEIPSENEAMFLSDLMPQPVKEVKKAVQKNNLPDITASKEVALSPLEQLLHSSKKTKEKFTIEVDVNLPSVELMKVLSASYDNGEEQILKFLASSIQTDAIKEKIAEQIAQKAFDKKVKTTKNKRNERLQSTV